MSAVSKTYCCTVRSTRLLLSTAAMAIAASGCASDYGWQTADASAEFVEGTHVLGELIMNVSKDQVMAGEGLLNGWRGKLHDLGYTDADIVDGSEVTVWTYCYGHNSGVPLCAHHGHYVVHVPAEYRQGLNFEQDGDPSTRGDLVEIELLQTSTGKIAGRLVGQYRPASDWADCRVESLSRGSVSTTMSILGGVGPPRANWIECSDAETDGWVRRRVVGAPPSDSFPVSEWIRFPAR